MYIESAKTVNEMTLNDVVKLTTLWTTGPRLRNDFKFNLYYAQGKFIRQQFDNIVILTSRKIFQNVVC